MSKPVCIFGEVLIDCYPEGHEVLGGAPFNVAWHLQAFGQSPVLVSRIGDDDEGRRIRDAMSDWGLRQEGLQIDEQHHTGRVEIILEDGEPSYLIAADSAYEFITSDALPPIKPLLIYHGSLALQKPATIAALSELKSRTNAPVVIDVNLRKHKWSRDTVLALLEDADWVKLNREELASLGGRGANLDAAEHFRVTYGLEGVVLTLGADGAIAVAASQEPVQVSPKFVIEVVDVVGAGDAFASVLILGLRLGWPMATTMERAQEFASELVQRQGATVSDPALYHSFCRRWNLVALK